MNGKKAKLLRKGVDTATKLQDYVTVNGRKGSTAILVPGHARAGYQAAKRIYNSRDSMNALFGRKK